LFQKFSILVEDSKKVIMEGTGMILLFTTPVWSEGTLGRFFRLLKERNNSEE